MKKDIETYLQTWKPQPIEMAHSFPAEMYTSETVYKLEQEQVFGKRWLYVGHISQIESPGSYFTINIVEQPLLIVHDLDGTLRGFFNICTHRAGPVASGSGKCNRFTCQYHAWTFDLQGNLKATPFMENSENFNHSNYGLKPIQVDAWGPFIFVNFDPDCKPFIEQLGELPEQFKRYNFSNLVKVHSIDYVVEANWKLYVENSAESYHVSMVHPTLQLFRSVNDLELSVQQNYYVEYLPFLPNSDEIKYGFKPGLYIEGLNEREMQGTSVTLFWMNFVLVTNPNFVLVRMINPQGLTETHVRFDWLVPNTNEAKSTENVNTVVELYDKVINEDLVMLKKVQERVRSHHYAPGRLSPLLEVGTHCFQQTLMEHIR